MEPLRRPVAGRHAGSRPEHNGPLSCLPRPGRPQPQPGQLCHQPACVPKCGGGFCHPPRLWGAHFACGVAPAAMETSTPTRWAGSNLCLAASGFSSCHLPGATWAWCAVGGPSPPPARPHTSLRAGAVLPPATPVLPGAQSHPAPPHGAAVRAATAESHHHRPVRDGWPSSGPRGRTPAELRGT